MCGIAGTINFSSETADINLLKRMSDTMSDRGPDGEGICIMPNPKVGLAHRRLAIIDLSQNAAQPMCNSDGTVWVVFNGEIYNHKELRDEIDSKRKVVWKTDHSDTEVIIHAYEIWGIECVHKLRGMFAIALYDPVKEKIYLIRDRLGIKPLYYGYSHNRINFASTVNALLQDDCQSRTVDKNALFDFISLLAVPAPNTLFKKIKKVPAGSWVEITLDRKIRRHCYWDICKNDQGENPKRSEDKMKKELMELLETSAALHKVSDVPIGIFLSGGVDSSTNLALFCNDSSTVNTYTVGYKNTRSYHNENDNARIMAEHCKAVHHDKYLTECDVIEVIDKLRIMCDDPVADPVIIPQMFIAEMAHEDGLKVIQVGEGADELFAGYSIWAKMARREKMNRLLPNDLKKCLYNRLKTNDRISEADKEMLKRASRDEAILWGNPCFVSDDKIRSLFSAEYLDEMNGHNTWDNFSKYYKRCKNKGKTDPTFWMGYVNMKFRLPDLLLARTDKSCMLSSLEGRVPFLDHKLVEWSMKVPENYKIRKHVHKYILKETVKEILPTEILSRPKEGFGLPYADWYNGSLGRTIKDNIFLFANESGFFDDKEIKRILRNPGSFYGVIWSLFILSLWWQQYASTSNKQEG